MKLLSKINLLLLALLVLPLNNLFAQQVWDTGAQTQFKTELVSLLKSCHNNFVDVKGKAAGNTKEGIKKYESTEKLLGFRTFILQLADSSYKLSATLKIDEESDDMDTVEDMLKQIAGYKVYDSDEDENTEAPDNADRILLVKSTDDPAYIKIIQYSKNDSYITIEIAKK